jgi:DNA-binding NtrC family response regulator
LLNTNKKILIVDDEMATLSLFEACLHRYFQVYTANNGKKALEVFSQHGPFPVVISDIVMPEMDGIQMGWEILKTSPATQLLFVSGSLDLQRVFEAFKMNVFCLPKPINPSYIKTAAFKLYAEALKPKNQIPNPTEVTVKPARQTLLLVDDCSSMRAFIKICIQHLNLEILEANNGEEAWDTINNRDDIGLMITDLQMPGMTGIELARKTGEQHPEIQVMGISGDLKEQTAYEMMELGIVCLPKPIEPLFIRNLICYILKRDLLPNKPSNPPTDTPDPSPIFL